MTNPTEKKIMPVDWLARCTIDGIEYRVDMSYNIWDMSKEEKIYHEAGTEEVDLRDVIRGDVLWEDSDDPFTFQDFLHGVLEIFSEEKGE